MGSEMFQWAPTASATTTTQEKIIKSNFTRTCNRFSQFLKERRSFGDLAAFNSSIASPKLEIKGAKDEYVPTNNMEMRKKSLDLFPLTSASTATSTENSTQNMADSRESSKLKEDQPKKTKASMTIFYGGQVLVFEDFPEDKAHEIMSLATKGNGSSTPTQTQAQTQTRAEIRTTQSTNFMTNYLTQGLSDLPIARRVSLNRFMEKRKDRIAASAPYQLDNSSAHLQHEKSFSMRTHQEEQRLELKL